MVTNTWLLNLLAYFTLSQDTLEHSIVGIQLSSANVREIAPQETYPGVTTDKASCLEHDYQNKQPTIWRIKQRQGAHLQHREIMFLLDQD